MAAFQITLLSFILIFSITKAQASFRPTALVIPVSKDASTLQYVAKINQRTPLVSTNLVIDLGGRFLWVDCDKHYVSSTYRPVRCRTSQCSLAGSNACGDCFDGPRPGCNNNTCGVFPENPVINIVTSGEVAEDVVSVQSTDGLSTGPVVTVPRFIFSCAPSFLLQNLASGVTGMAGLGRTRIALSSQFASAFSFKRKFVMCLSGSGSSTSNGVIIFGNDPYKFFPNFIFPDQTLTTTPLLINPVSTAATYTQGEPSVEYFIGVKSIKIDSNKVALNTSLLSINSEGIGGTKISTINPYTVLETSIYKAVTEAFIKESAARNITRVASVAPFGVCLSTTNVFSTRVGASVPYIDLVLQSESVVWTITGSNSMVEVNDNVLCLGVVDGGLNPITSIVIGGYQLEDNLLQFDLATSRLGFTDVPFKFLPNVDASKILTFTPILTHPSPDMSAEYFIGVKKIKVNGKVVPIDTALLSIQNGGTQLTTGNPNTVMRTSIYNAVTSAFINEAAAMNITRVASVAPFGACFDAKTVLGSRLGAKVPFIDLILQNENVVWTITGSNSMVEIGNNVLCLGFVDGGKDPRIPIIIGTHQLENNVLQFDLATSRLGFSNTLLARQTTCANFNFTSTA